MNSRLAEKTAKIIGNHQLCFSCLGRLFGQLGHGLTNPERGKALYRFSAMHEDRSVDIEAEEKNPCEICGDLYRKLDERAERGQEKLKNYEFSSFLVGNRMRNEVSRKQRKLEKLYDLENSEEPGREFNREVGKKLFYLLSDAGKGVDVDLEDPHVHIVYDLNEEALELQVKPIFIYGRYRKLSRKLPQSPWHCSTCEGEGCEECNFTGRVYPDSIAEIIGEPIRGFFEGSDFSFHGAGREDVDAKTLGRGRPFVLEVSVPRRRQFDSEEVMRGLRRKGKEKLEVLGLRKVKGDLVEKIKEKKVDKEYRAVVESFRDLSEEKFEDALDRLEGEIKQRTPKRVSHRRADKYRFRNLKNARGRRLGEGRFEVNLRCSSGLYVKELISSDGGRTEPSLSGLLGMEVRVEELDVTEVYGILIKEADGKFVFRKGEPDG